MSFSTSIIMINLQAVACNFFHKLCNLLSLLSNYNRKVLKTDCPGRTKQYSTVKKEHFLMNIPQ